MGEMARYLIRYRDDVGHLGFWFRYGYRITQDCDSRDTGHGIYVDGWVSRLDRLQRRQSSLSRDDYADQVVDRKCPS